MYKNEKGGNDVMKIGVTCRALKHPDFDLEIHGVTSNYLASLRAAGAIPIMIPIGSSMAELTALVELLDGIVFSGGSDINPSFYGEEQKQGIGPIDVNRDASEWQVMELAYRLQKPILGICRGAQLLNVYAGGTMIQDMRYVVTDLEHEQKCDYAEVSHAVQVTKGSKLSQFFGGREQILTNSFHHQVIGKLGMGLIATAFASDGVIEGIEGTDPEHLVLGVQFHPEMFVGKEPTYMQGIFTAFVQQCTKM